MSQRPQIQRYEISSSAKAGIAVRNLQTEYGKEEHDNTIPHRDNHYLLMVATHGHFKISLDFKALIIDRPSLLVISPGQVHHVPEITAPQGWIISFDPSLVEEELEMVIEKDLQLPMELDPQTSFYQQVTLLMSLMEQIHLGADKNHYRDKSIHALLDALLCLVAGKISGLSGDKRAENRAAFIEQSFNHLLKQHYKTWKKPVQYATALHISVPHLYDIVKSISGNSVSDQIQQYAILEAKRLLYFTKLSVREIGYELGYDEPVYFGKLFKKVTGLTPLEFRKRHRDQDY